MQSDPERPTVFVVDAANVVGSVPDGWWRDRRGATERLRDRLAGPATDGLAEVPGPLEVTLVIEGRARGVAATPTVGVIEARASGDDAIVEYVAAQGDRNVVVVTADRELKSRVHQLGARTLGPSVLTR